MRLQQKDREKIKAKHQGKDKKQVGKVTVGM